LADRLFDLAGDDWPPETETVSQYDQLVRLRDWELDEKKRALAEIQALIDKWQALEDEVVREQAVTASSYEASIGCSAFAKAVI
jgi:hypothetical protein